MGAAAGGVVTAAELLTEAAFIEGLDVKASPRFGPQRMGAPVMSFCRIDDKPIAVGINSIECFLGDEVLRCSWKASVDALGHLGGYARVVWMPVEQVRPRR